MKKILVMDTNIIKRQNYFINTDLHNIIKFICISNDIEVIYPSLVLDELENNFHRDINEEKSSLIKHYKKIQRKIPDLAEDDLVRKIESSSVGFIHNFMQDNLIMSHHEIPYDILSISEVMERYFHDSYFKSEIKNFKDLLIWMQIEKYANDNETHVLFISQDNLFHPDNMKEYYTRINNGITHYGSIIEFINEYSKVFTGKFDLLRYIPYNIIGIELEYYFNDLSYLFKNINDLVKYDPNITNIYLDIKDVKIIREDCKIHKVKKSIFISGKMNVFLRLYYTNSERMNISMPKIFYKNEHSDIQNIRANIGNRFEITFNASVYQEKVETFNIRNIDQYYWADSKYNPKRILSPKETL